ncbi:MAG TPA: hypothetical protein VFV50_15005 [Bdellovibrionales bacterium]|nr:hypothetical protein [Bdellovibrionales bacterium]
MRKHLAEIFPLVLTSQIFIGPVFAQDVYNFYFQKGAPPATVIQGGAGQRSEAQALPSQVQPEQAPSGAPASPSETSEVATTVTKLNAASDRGYKSWELQVGPAYVADVQGHWTGASLAGQYNFSKYIGLQLGVLYAPKNDAYGEMYDKDQAWDASLAAVVTPVHVNLFGREFLQVSALGGFMTTRKSELVSVPSYDYGYGTYRYETRETSSQTRVVKPFLGVGLALNFAQSFGMYAQAKVISENSAYGQANAGLVVRF